MNRLSNWFTSSVLLAALIAGCSKPDASPPVSPATESNDTATNPATDLPVAKAAPSQGVTKIPASELPIGDYMPPLDDDRIEIAKPKGWQALPRDSDFVTRFYETNRNGLPRIEIKVEPKAYGDLTTATPANVEQFAKLVLADLGDLDLVETVVPLQVGDVPCARYVGRVELRLSAGQKIIAERQRLVVLNDGRQYTIDLLVLPNTIRKSRNAAYAVCASLRFGGASQADAPTGQLLPE